MNQRDLTEPTHLDDAATEPDGDELQAADRNPLLDWLFGA